MALLALVCFIIAVVLLVLASVGVGPPRISLGLLAAAFVVFGWLLLPAWTAAT